MKKCSMLLVFLLLNTLSPNAEAEPLPDPNMIIQISQKVNSGSSGSQTLEETDENSEGMTTSDENSEGNSTSDEHNSEGDCSHWSYPSTNWPSKCSQYCDGERQSPIDIVTTSPLPNMTGSALNMDNYYPGPVPSVNIKNNGHSVTISWDSPQVHEISEGGLDGNYTLAQFHFHWGCDNSSGSEHTVDGKSYPMEMHLVHYKASYGSLGEAIKHSDGLAVIGVFWEIGVENADLKPITDNLSNITAPGTDADITFNKEIVFLTSPPMFYRYKGSLTTPTCNEVVIWSVFEYPMQLSQAQMDAFRSLQDHDGNTLCNNYRAVQPLNGRIVSQEIWQDPTAGLGI